MREPLDMTNAKASAIAIDPPTIANRLELAAARTWCRLLLDEMVTSKVEYLPPFCNVENNKIRQFKCCTELKQY